MAGSVYLEAGDIRAHVAVAWAACVENIKQVRRPGVSAPATSAPACVSETPDGEAIGE